MQLGHTYTFWTMAIMIFSPVSNSSNQPLLQKSSKKCHKYKFSSHFYIPNKKSLSKGFSRILMQKNVLECCRNGSWWFPTCFWSVVKGWPETQILNVFWDQCPHFSPLLASKRVKITLFRQKPLKGYPLRVDGSAE